MARSAGFVRCWKEIRHVLERDMLRLKEGGQRNRRLIVKNEVCNGKRLSGKEGKDFLEGRDVGRCRTSFDRQVVDITKVKKSDKRALVAFIRGNRKASGQIRRRPFGTMDSSDPTGGEGRGG
jgi:hypothetical protein